MIEGATFLSLPSVPRTQFSSEQSAMKQVTERNPDFTFVHITNSKPTRQWKAKNETVVRSHVMKNIRRQKKDSKQLRTPSQKPALKSKCRSPVHQDASSKTMSSW